MNSMSHSFVSPPPKIWKDAVYRVQAPKARPINARPDLSKVIYRHPLRVGCLAKVRAVTTRIKRIERAVLSSRTGAASAFDVSQFSAIRLRAGQKITAEMVVRAMLPGFPKGLSGNDVLGRSRVPAVALARQVAYYVMVHGFGISFAQTGRRFGVDHTSAMHGIGKVRGLIEAGALPDPLPFVCPDQAETQTLEAAE